MITEVIELPPVSHAVIEVVDLGPVAATRTFEIEGRCMPDRDWEQYIAFEAQRRGVSTEAIRQQERMAQAKLIHIALDRAKLYAAAKASPVDHPFLHDDDSPLE